MFSPGGAFATPTIKSTKATPATANHFFRKDLRLKVETPVPIIAIMKAKKLSIATISHKLTPPVIRINFIR